MLCGVLLASACQNRGGDEVEQTSAAIVAAAGMSSQNLNLQVLTASCTSNQAQDTFKVTNNDTASVKLSDITLKLWVDDTSAAAIVPAINYGGCVGNASGCLHQVTGVTATATQFSPACGSDASHQANWEITITNSDGSLLSPGSAWSNTQLAIHLASWGSFAPGTGVWYSQCLSSTYHDSSRYAVYVKGNLVTASAGVPPSCRAPHGTQQLTGEIPPGVSDDFLVGPLPTSTQVTVAIGLPLRNQAALQTLIQQLYDPTSPNYRKYLTPAAFGAAYGATASDYSAVQSFATTNGLTVVSTYDGNDLVLAKGPVSAVESAFFVTLNLYRRADGSTYYAPANEPSLNLSVPIQYVSGLHSFAMARPALGGTGPAGHCSPHVADGSFAGSDFRKIYFPGCTTLDGSGQTIGLFEFSDYYDADITDYRSVFGLTGPIPVRVPVPTIPVLQSGVTVSPCDTFGSTGIISSASAAPVNCRRTNTISTSPFTVALQDVSSEGEVSLDIEMAMAMAPNATIRVYEANTGNVSVDALAILHAMANEPAATRPGTISSSWTWLSGVPDLNLPPVFQQFAVEGQSYYQASMDTGAFTPGGALPAVWSPIIDTSLMTTVGGTELSTNAGLAYGSEVVWNDTPAVAGCSITSCNPNNGICGCNSVSGGGVCKGYTVCINGSGALTYQPVGTVSGPGLTCASGSFQPLPIPSYQASMPAYLTGAASALGQISATTRMIPDVSMVADQLAVFTAVLAGVTATTGRVEDPIELCSGGTSAAAPLWAAVGAMANQQQQGLSQPPIGFANPTLYTVAAGSAAAYAGPAGAFHDVTSGSNVYTGNAVSPNLYQAVAGYDMATGLGTPNGVTCSPLNVIPPQSCLPGSSLTTLIDFNSGATKNVTAYVPNGSWSELVNDVKVVSIEGSVTSGTIATPNPVNTCAGNSLTGQVVCTSNGTDVYVIQGNAIVSTLTSGATGTQTFSGGTCATCNVVLDPLHNVGFLSIGTGTGAAYQPMNLATATPTLGTPIQSGQQTTSEDMAVDGLRGLVLSPNEGFVNGGSPNAGNYQLLNETTGAVFNFTPATPSGAAGGFDMAAEDCTTGIALSADEFTNAIFLTDLTQANFTGSNWSSTFNFQSVSQFSSFAAGTSGVAVASGSHLGAVAGEFGSNTFGIFQLPATSGSGTPALVDWIAAAIPSTPDSVTWQMGLDPHTVSAYTSPNNNKQYAVFEDDATGNGVRTYLAVVDMQAIMNPSVTTRDPDGHTISTPLITCSGPGVNGTPAVPGCIVRFIQIP